MPKSHICSKVIQVCIILHNKCLILQIITRNEKQKTDINFVCFYELLGKLATVKESSMNDRDDVLKKNGKATVA